MAITSSEIKIPKSTYAASTADSRGLAYRAIVDRFEAGLTNTPVVGGVIAMLENDPDVKSRFVMNKTNWEVYKEYTHASGLVYKIAIKVDYPRWTSRSAHTSPTELRNNAISILSGDYSTLDKFQRLAFDADAAIQVTDPVGTFDSYTRIHSVFIFAETSWNSATGSVAPVKHGPQSLHALNHRVFEVLNRCFADKLERYTPKNAAKNAEILNIIASHASVV